ncbi:hypothetical protein, partial [Zavarzinella formosa]|uniref:hypothetical protein n=1 Tax=Zavarzinella formosa TaxID=360055 RepID=UPI0019309194
VVSAGVPPALVTFTTNVATALAAGKAAGVISGGVATLTQGVLKTIFLKKFMTTAALLLAGAAVVVGGSLVLAQTESPAGHEVKSQKPAKAAEVNDAPPRPQADKPPHIAEKPDMMGRMASGLPSRATEDGSVVVKSFFAKMATYPDIRFRDFFDPRYLKKHGLTDREIAFEIADHQGIASLRVADDKLTVIVVLRFKGGEKEVFVMRCAVLEDRIYISPEKAPDPNTGIIKPWILRMKP